MSQIERRRGNDERQQNEKYPHLSKLILTFFVFSLSLKIRFENFNVDTK